jgi:hypothetical protein
MALVESNSLTTTGTGASDWFLTDPGDTYLVVAWAGSAGDTALEVSHDATTWGPVNDAAGAVQITSDYTCIVPGGLYYRLNVTTHASAATMTKHKVDYGLH